MIKANKGEWSELYVLLKLIERPILFLANDNLEIEANAKIPVNKIKRFEGQDETPTEYLPLSEGTQQIVRTDSSGIRNFVIDRTQLRAHVVSLLNKISHAPARSSSFSIPEAVEYMSEVGCLTIKAGSSKKADIILDIIDRGQLRADVGYSIKSMIGGASTLFNTSQHSEIICNVDSFSGNLDEINSVVGSSKYRKRISKIIGLGGKISFDRMSSKFSENLKYIDTNFPVWLSSIVINYYSGKGASLSEASSIFAREVGLSEDLIKFKMKQFLVHAALGMTAGKIWDGLSRAEGGYLIVKESGEIACYQAYSKEKFADYLFQNTKIDTPSGGRHKFGKLLKENGKLKLKLNFQIRYSK